MSAKATEGSGDVPMMKDSRTVVSGDFDVLDLPGATNS